MRLNALRHGLDSAPGALLPGEDPAERAALARAYREDLRPGTREEEDLVARLIETAWLERRAHAAAYAAAEEAIAAHGPGTDVLALEAGAGGRGPFLRAEAWSCRLTGRFLRLVRQLERARGAARGASRLRGTKPLVPRGARRNPTGPFGRPGDTSSPTPANAAAAGNKAIAPAPAGARPVTAPKWAGPTVTFPSSKMGNKAIAPTTTSARSAQRGPPIPGGVDRNSRSDAWIAGNKAIAPSSSPTPGALVCSTAGNKAIARPAAQRLLGRAVGPVAAGLTRIRFESRAGTTAGAAASAAATPRDQQGSG